jgi:hypothetical protein
MTPANAGGHAGVFFARPPDFALLAHPGHTPIAKRPAEVDNRLPFDLDQNEPGRPIKNQASGPGAGSAAGAIAGAAVAAGEEESQ